MTDSQRPQTMLSTSAPGTPFLSGRQHPKWREEASLLEEMAGILATPTFQPTGNVVRVGKKNEKHVEYSCTHCNKLSLLYPSNVRLKKTTDCKCQRGVKYGQDPRALILGERYDAIVQRCNAPENELYKNYGARGIRLLFDDRQHFIRWMLEHLPHESYKGVQIDRTNNDGHYEPGNLRLVTQRENLRNRRNNRWFDYFGERVLQVDLGVRILKDFPHFPYASESIRKLFSMDRLTVVQVLLHGGVTFEQMDAVALRMSTTSPTQAPGIVSPVKTG